MLAKLWQADAADVKASLAALASKGVLNVAQLPDGRVWCLPNAQQLALVTAAARDAAPAYHRLVLDAYCASLLPPISEEDHGSPPARAEAAAALGAGLGGLQLGGGAPGGAPGGLSTAGLLRHASPAQRLKDLPDDGYILINLGHHLTAGGRAAQVRAAGAQATSEPRCWPGAAAAGGPAGAPWIACPASRRLAAPLARTRRCASCCWAHLALALPCHTHLAAR